MSFLQQKIEFLKGVGPAKAELLQKELGIYTVQDMLVHYPFRYIDKTQFQQIRLLSGEEDYVQLKGYIVKMEIMGSGRAKRLVGTFTDGTGAIEIIWFQGIKWIAESLKADIEYILYGRLNVFNRKFNIPHPELDPVKDNSSTATSLAPVYSSSEKLNSRGVDSKAQRRILRQIFEKLSPYELPENLPEYLISKMRLISHYEASKLIHFPTNAQELLQAQQRLKFEELLFMQLRILQYKQKRHNDVRGFVFEKVGKLFNDFYNNHLSFELTNAQKRVLKEIRKDLAIGNQMNRLLQGDVGSGKTIVALMVMLLAIDNGYQACLMAPTEILAQQHYNSISEMIKPLGIEIAFHSGSIKGNKRKLILEELKSGKTKIIIGTHALLEDPVEFKELGVAIIDEQHRFGVKQRSALWSKNKTLPPHILVMTATPIPRTLAMTLYGDLDISVIDELPPGRKLIQTLHYSEHKRLRLFGFMREEIKKGRQIYVVYPIIEESEKLDLIDLQNGYNALEKEFPLPEFQISVVHGRMRAEDKESEMQRFVKGLTNIMVATTVIEVGVNVPNASVMIIEHAERFGLSQLHQLRGRVGRGADQSYCILMTSYKLTTDGKERIKTMCDTNDGFVIAEVDLKLRGPGDLEGTQQSGLLGLSLADLGKDGAILSTAREIAHRILDNDPDLIHPRHVAMKRFMDIKYANYKDWSSIS